jgi:hypothetical protein
MPSFRDQYFVHPDDISLSDVISVGTSAFSAYVNMCNNEYSREAAVDHSDRRQPQDDFYQLMCDFDSLCTDINRHFYPMGVDNVAVMKRNSIESQFNSVSTHFDIDSGQLIEVTIEEKLAIIAKLEAQGRGKYNEYNVRDRQRVISATDD